MNLDPNKIIKNFFSMSFGQFLNLLINFLTIPFAARYLGVENFGAFGSLLATVTILSRISDFGFGPVVFRENARGDHKFFILNNAISLKIIFAFLVIILYNLTALTLSLSLEEIILVNLLYLNIFISARMANFREILSIPFKTKLKMHYPMIINFIDNLLLLILVLLMPTLNAGLNYFIGAYIICNIPGIILLIYYIRKKFNYSFYFNLRKSKWLLKETLPLMGFVIFSTIFQQIDILFLNYLKGSYSAGIFTASSRLTFPLNIIPEAVVTTIFPILVSRINKKENIAELLKIVYKFLFIVPFSIALVFAFHFEEFILIIFGNEYIESGLPTAIIISTQVFLFFNFFSLDLFTALSKQKYNFYYAFLIVLINVVLNFLLIPKYDYLGAAYSKIITSFVGTIFIVVILSKLKVDFNFINKKMLISLLILAILLYFASFLNIFAYLLISLILILISNRYNWLFDSKELLLIAKLFRAEKLFKKLFKINLD